MIFTIDGIADAARATCAAQTHVSVKRWAAADLGTYRTPSLLGRFRPSSVVTG